MATRTDHRIYLIRTSCEAERQRRKFFYDVNVKSRAVKRSGVQLRNAFKIGDFDTTSTLSWALEGVLKRRSNFVHK